MFQFIFQVHSLNVHIELQSLQILIFKLKIIIFYIFNLFFLHSFAIKICI